MSRSYKQPNFTANSSARSEKGDKKIWHSRMRARQRDQFAHIQTDNDDIVPVSEKEVSNPYDMAKDGRHYWAEHDRIEFAKRTAANDENPDVKVERLLAKQRSK